MLIVFVVLILIVSLVLGLIVLIQNPKGGGLSGTFGGFGNQLMGVKQTTDILEKGTWVFAAAVGILCIISPVFMNGGSGSGDKLLDNMSTKQQPATPKAVTPSGTTVPMPADSQPR